MFIAILFFVMFSGTRHICLQESKTNYQHIYFLSDKAIRPCQGHLALANVKVLSPPVICGTSDMVYPINMWSSVVIEHLHEAHLSAFRRDLISQYVISLMASFNSTPYIVQFTQSATAQPQDSCPADRYATGKALRS